MARETSAESPRENIEELILGIPALSHAVEPPVMFAQFMDVIAPMIDLPKTSEFVLDAFSSRDVTAEKLSLALKGNAYFQQIFYQVIDSIRKPKEGEAPPTLETAIVLLGMQNSRNLILGVQLQRQVLGTHPEWTKEGKLKTQPKELLKHALSAEEANAGKKEDYVDLAFSAGMLFDAMAMISDAQEHRKKLGPFVDSVYKQGYKAAQIATEIAKTIPGFSSRRNLFAACMVHGVGKIAMGILQPAYLDFVEECSKKDLPRAVRRRAERRLFGVNHSLLGSLICSYFKIFAPFSSAVLYQDEPFLLLTREKRLFELCAMISLSANIAANFKKIDKLDDPVLERWKGPELSNFKIDMGKVLQAVAQVP